MILKDNRSLEDNRYIVELEPTNWSDQDVALMKKFGEPEVETGGQGTLIPAFDFPTEPREIKKGFPYTRSIDADADSDAKAKMNNWVIEMQTRFTNALNTLRANVDDFSGTGGTSI